MKSSTLNPAKSLSSSSVVAVVGLAVVFFKLRPVVLDLVAARICRSALRLAARSVVICFFRFATRRLAILALRFPFAEKFLVDFLSLPMLGVVVVGDERFVVLWSPPRCDRKALGGSLAVQSLVVPVKDVLVLIVFSFWEKLAIHSLSGPASPPVFAPQGGGKCPC